MKKLFLIILIFYSFPFNNAYSQKFRAGIVGGFVVSDICGFDPDGDFVDFHKAGVTGGGILNAKFSEKNSVQLELLYTQKGLYYPPDSLGSGNNFSFFKLNLDYIEIPILFRHKFSFSSNQKMINRFCFEFGPSIGSLIRIKSEGLLFVDGQYLGDFGNANKNQFKQNEIAINFGFNYSISNNFSFNIRCTNSLIHVVKQAPLTYKPSVFYTFNKGNNVVIAFSLRYMFSPSEEEK